MLQFDKPTDGLVNELDKRQLTSHSQLLHFLYAGNATLTVKSLRTGTRFTYRIKEAPGFPGKDPGPVGWFVAVLTGPDNTADYTYLGHIFRESRDYVHGKKSKIGIGADSAIAFEWFYGSIVLAGALRPTVLQVWHEGRCGRCNRKLTVPESIESGFGADCAEIMGIQWGKAA